MPIFQQAPIGIAINEPSADGSRLVAINKMYEEITGRSKEELLQLGWVKIPTRMICRKTLRT